MGNTVMSPNAHVHQAANELRILAVRLSRTPQTLHPPSPRFLPEDLNQHLSELDVDHLYHIGMDSDMPLEDMFGDVRCVCVGGSATRMESFANLLAKEADVPLPTGTALTNLSSTDR